MALFNDLFGGDRSLMTPYMMNLGLGLIQAGQPQPYGVNRYSHIANALQQAQQNLMAQQQLGMQRKLFERKEKQERSQERARSTLFGGYDPTTDITWQTGRGLMDEGQKASLMAQGYPEEFGRAAVAQQFPGQEKKYTNVPTVGLVDVSGPEPKVVIPAKEKQSIAEIIAPVLAKRARGEDLTTAEQDVVDWWMRADVLDLALRQALNTPGAAVPAAPAAPAIPPVSAVPPPEAGPKKRETITVEGKSYEILERLPDGSVKIRDPMTGKTGTYRP